MTEERGILVRDLAAEYADLVIKGEKETRRREKEIASIVAIMVPVEVAYFCQQMVSYFKNVHLASMSLTVLVNRMISK